MIILRRLMVVEEPNSQVFLHDSSVRVENFTTTNHGPRLPRTEASIFQVMLISAPAMSDLVPPENPLRASHKKRTTVPSLGNNPTTVTNRPQVGEYVIRVDLPETGVSKIHQTVGLRNLQLPRIITIRLKMKARADISLVPPSLLKWKMTLLEPILPVETVIAVLTVIEEAKDVAVINMTTQSTKDPKLPMAPKSGIRANVEAAEILCKSNLNAVSSVIASASVVVVVAAAVVIVIIPLLATTMVSDPPMIINLRQVAREIKEVIAKKKKLNLRVKSLHRHHKDNSSSSNLNEAMTNLKMMRRSKLS
jgi:hypothetical protein